MTKNEFWFLFILLLCLMIGMYILQTCPEVLSVFENILDNVIVNPLKV